MLISSYIFQCHSAVDFLSHSPTQILSNLFTLFLFLKFFNWFFHLFFIIKDGEITIAERDGAAHVLRCLKVWYDLSNDVLFTAINLVDRFLTKMKVRPKHMSCISIGSLHLAIKQLGVVSIDTEDLVAISQVSSIFILFKYIHSYLFKCKCSRWMMCVVTLVFWRENLLWRQGTHVWKFQNNLKLIYFLY